jgi:hypothetical protein
VSAAPRKTPSRRWRSSYTHPARKGWYEVRAMDDRWGGETRWRAWGNGQWWTQLAGGGWMGLVEWAGQYQWRGPCIDIGLDYPQVIERVYGVGVAA